MVPDKPMKAPLPFPNLLLRALPFVGLVAFAAVVALWLDGGLRPEVDFIPKKHAPDPPNNLDIKNHEQARSGFECFFSSCGHR